MPDKPNNITIKQPNMKLLGLICVLLPFVFADPIVQIKNGQIKGRIVTTKSGIEFYSYTDVKYAKPPLGELRFQPPQPAEDWDGVLDCTKNTRHCFNLGSTVDTQSEDCLLLNVYTKVPPGTNASLPVIYHFFGGGFIYGSATFNSNGPHYFMEHDVVIVTVNYRLGPFGFLSTGDLASPGNYGLKDQLLGLKWIHENIHVFGGDPTKITLFGLSAGSASTTYHVISKQSAGLFRASMGESGTALCPFAFQRDHTKLAYQLAKLVDSTFNESSSSEELVELLRTIPAKDLNAAADKVKLGYTDQVAKGRKFTPALEPDHEGAFLTEEMYESIEKGNVNKVPMMLGLGSEEQLSRIGSGIDKFKTDMAAIDQNVSLLVPMSMHLPEGELKETVGQEVREIYTDGLWQDDPVASIKVYSDTCFSRPIIRHAELHSQYADSYFYIFSYHGGIGGNNNYLEGTGRVQHGEYSNYVWAFNGNDNRLNYNESDVTTSKRYVKMLVNFATHLNPTPEPEELLQNITFPKIEQGNYQYLDINTDWTIKKNPKSPHYAKWLDLFDNRAIRPFDQF